MRKKVCLMRWLVVYLLFRILKNGLDCENGGRFKGKGFLCLRLGIEEERHVEHTERK